MRQYLPGTLAAWYVFAAVSMMMMMVVMQVMTVMTMAV